MDTTQAMWFGVLFAATLAWFGLASRLFGLLKESHPEIYESLGSPSLFLNNSISNNWSSLKFLATGSYRNLDDDRVTRLCQFMRLFLIAYAAWFIGPIVWMLVAR